MKTPKIKTVSLSEVEFTIECEPEYLPVEGNFDSGDAEADREMERRIIADLESGNEWAWCVVKVTARYGNFVGADYLGGCSYASKQDFSTDGYCFDMKRAALEDLNRNIRETVESIRPFVVCE